MCVISCKQDPVHRLSFLVFWSICWSSSLVYFKNDPLYLIRGIVQVRFLLQSLISRRFCFLSFFLSFFLSSPLVWWCLLPTFPSTCKFPFLRAFWFFFDLVAQEDKINVFLSLRVFGLLSSSLLLFPQCFGQYVLWSSSGVCWTLEPSRNFEVHLLLNPRGSLVLIPLAITGYKC